MNTNISLDKFNGLLSELFGQPLNAQAEVASQNFWENINEINDGIANGYISINVNILRLARSFPEYKGYQTWNGLGILLLVVALPTFFFSWIVALGLVAGCFISSTIGGTQRNSTGQKFINGIQEAILAGDMQKGLSSLCAHYIAGNVQLTSSHGHANWPQVPSDVLKGEPQSGFHITEYHKKREQEKLELLLKQPKRSREEAYAQYHEITRGISSKSSPTEESDVKEE